MTPSNTHPQNSASRGGEPSASEEDAEGFDAEGFDDELRRAEVAKGVYQKFRQRYFSSQGRSPSRPKQGAQAAQTRGEASSPPPEKAGEGPSRSDFFRAVQRIEETHALKRAAGEKIPPHTSTPRAPVDGQWRSLTERKRNARGTGGGESWKPSDGVARGKTGSGPSWWDPQPIGKILSVETKKRGWERSLTIGEVTANWEKIVGPHVGEHCPIESFEGGTLVARASSTAWAQQLQLLLPLIHKRIDEMVGPGVVEKVLVYPPKAPSWGSGPRRVKGRGPRDTYG